MSDLTSKLLSGIKPGVEQLKIYDVRIADMNDAQCRLALMWFISNQPTAATAETPSAKLHRKLGVAPKVRGK